MTSGHPDLLGPDHDARRRSKSRRWKSFAAVLISLVALGLLAGAVVIGGQRVFGKLGGAPSDYEGAGTGEVTVVIPPGAGGAKIGQLLAAAGVIKSASAYREAAAANEKSTKVQPGTYTLRREMKAATALDMLLDPKNRQRHRVVIAEGLTTKQILAEVAKKTKIPMAELQAAAKSGKALGLPSYADGKAEGFFFPATYDLEPGMKAIEVLKKMVDRFKQEEKALDLLAEADKVGLEPLDVITLASMIEEETKIKAERAKVSRVIHNRLDAGTRLQIDATVQYALPKPKPVLSAADLKIDSPYNTYLNKGLPPGPIASPGRASIEAALAPAEGPWLYYVVTDAKTGKHAFTASYTEFINLKNKAKQDAGG
jgi:UPF0755 protein